MRRISADNHRPLGRLLAKPTHIHPLDTIACVLGQLESYDNLIGPTVEAMRYIPALAHDAMYFIMASRLGTFR